MKTNKITKAVVTLLCAAVGAGLMACTTDVMDWKSGKLPDKDAVENTYGYLTSSGAAEQQVYMLLTQGAGSVTDKFYYQITQSAPASLSLDIRVDASEETLATFNTAHETEYVLLPETNYELPDGKSLTLTQDGKRTDSKRIRILAGGLEPGFYLLPVTVSDTGIKGKKQTLYYTITIRQPQLGDKLLYKGDDLFFVFYINTKEYQPLLVDDYYMRKNDMSKWPPEEIWYNTIGNIINLRTVTIDYEAVTQRAKLNLGKDMTHVLNHVVKYIRPLQDKGRKVCISIEGGGTGLGFCNLTDLQMADFAAQVKAVVESYELDGINLWDRNTGYGMENMPAMNTTSYPKLIKALREALGSEKLLTVTVYDKPTETFYDTAASGGIAVGDYIDYAWSGYNSEQESPQVLDPWHVESGLVDWTGQAVISAYTQKPIANLNPAKFGCVNFPLYGGSTPMEIQDQSAVLEWVTAGYSPNKMIVFSDLRTILQDSYETIWDLNFEADSDIIAGDGLFNWDTPYQYFFDKSKLGQVEENRKGYGKWLKDW